MKTQDPAVALPQSGPKENVKLAQALYERQNSMVIEYRQLIAHTGNYLATSMGVAYAKGLADAIRFLIKQGETNEKTNEQTQETSSPGSTEST